MKVGIISDLHGYRLPTQMAMDDLRRFMGNRPLGSVICLGDITSGGNQEDEVVSILKNNAVRNIKGNHCRSDKNEEDISDILKDYIENSEDYISYDDFYQNGRSCMFVHDNPLSVLEPYDARIGRPPWESDSGIKTDEQAEEVFKKTHFDLIFVGHTHQPESWEMTKKGEIIYHHMNRGKLNPESRYIINPGAVADPKVLTPHAVANPRGEFTSNYAVFDTEKMQLFRFQRELFRDGKPVFDVPEKERWIYR